MDLVEVSGPIEGEEEMDAWVRSALKADESGLLAPFFTTTRCYFAPLSERILEEEPRSWIRVRPIRSRSEGGAGDRVPGSVMCWPLNNSFSVLWRRLLPKRRQDLVDGDQADVEIGHGAASFIAGHRRAVRLTGAPAPRF